VVARGEQLRVQGAYASAAEVRQAVTLLSRQTGGQSGSPASGLGQRVVDATHKWVQRLPALAGAGR